MSFSQKERRAVRVDFTNDRGLTEQSHKESCDIHTIMRKAQKTGVIEHVNQYQGKYGEMPTGEEFHVHMNAIAAAETMFETVPSGIRKKFENDPSKFLDFVQNDDNYIEMEEMGFDVSHLKPPKPKQEPATAPKSTSEPVPTESEEK